MTSTDASPTGPEAKAPPPQDVRTAAELQAACRRNLDTSRELLARILAVKGERTIENTLSPYNHLSVHAINAASKAGLFANVHPDKAMRDAGDACEREVVSFLTDVSLNRELFEAFAAVDVAKLDPDARRLVEKTLKDFRRAGVDKDEATRKRLRELSDKQVELGQTFDKNIRDDVRSIEVDPAKLDGLPEDWRKAHAPGPNGKVKITTDYPDYIPFRTYAKDAASRLELYKVYLTRGYPTNKDILQELLALRREQARLLGFASWADYITENKMIGSGAKVREFVDRVSRLAEKRAKKDYAQLLARKRKDLPRAKSVDESDSLYYEELVKRESFKVDSQEARPYFEYGRVRDGLLATTSKIFGVQYRRAADAPVWHPDVEAYDVLADGKTIGRIYLDMHPREGKYKHAAQFAIVKGVVGTQLPEGALVCNFPNPRTTSPALMEHDQVETMFHEFGHLMHHIVGGGQTWAYFSGVETEWDFVEAPSQLLEEWAWDAATLRTFAKHHETGEPIPEELVARMKAAKEFGIGTFVRRQMFLASLSLRYHTDDPAKLDLDKALVAEQKKYSLYPYVEGTRLYANFGHLNGYSAMYYTYMWSLVIAKDLFSAFEEKGLYDAETARRYRDLVLAPGGARDAKDLVVAFLGRPYSFDAFERWLNR